MKKYVLILISVLGLVFAASVSAINSEIGFVDVVKIMQQLPGFSQLKKQFAARAEELKAAASALQKHAQEFERNGPVMTDKEKSTEQKRLLQETEDLQKQRTQFTQDFQDAQLKLVRKITSRIETVVAKIAKQRHYDLVLQKSAVLYHKDTNDITEQVLQSLK